MHRPAQRALLVVVTLALLTAIAGCPAAGRAGAGGGGGAGRVGVDVADCSGLPAARFSPAPQCR